MKGESMIHDTPRARISRTPDPSDRFFAGRIVHPIWSSRWTRRILVAFPPGDEIGRQFGFRKDDGRSYAIVEPESIEYPPQPFMLRIEGTDYHCMEIGSQADDVSAVFRVEREPTHKEASKGLGPFVYDVSVHSGGWIQCTCPHYEFRLRDTDGVCKHILGCIEAGRIQIPATTERA
jgi:hypothetical protein